jgi:hypothetical protein
MDRRKFLRGTGAAAIGLPLLDAMGPSLGKQALAASATATTPKRFVAMCAGLGFHTPYLFPESETKDFSTTPYLKKLMAFQDQITVFSGLSHPNQQGNNGHASQLTWLTSAQRPGLAGFKNSISIDQQIAQQIGTQTRHPFLTLSTTGGSSLSWSSNGVAIPGISSASKLFASLFVDGTQQQVAVEMQSVLRGKSILDTVGGRASELVREIGHRDQEKVEEYLTAVRDLESRLQQSEGWIAKPKPKVDSKLPVDITDKADAIAKQRLLYDMIVLALQTDSTRTITFSLEGLNAAPKIPGVNSDWHGLSHHGKDPEKIDELKIIEEAEFTAFAEFLGKLETIREGDRTLLENTTVLFGSNLGNASAHDWHNLPILVAGGGFRHRGYVAHDARNNTPLANLFVALAQNMGVEIERFGSSTSSSVRGLES